MSNIEVISIALAVFSVSSMICGIIMLVIDIIEYKRELLKKQKPPVWFHSMDLREEVEKTKGEKEGKDEQ